MYKTVRHGESSLQYKILAQQEEGLPGVKRRKSPKTFVVKLIGIVTLLIVLIMASAFLVPLLFANDFIAVTGTFQKFSVSTLRRSHSGNNVVVIAKKPYGWNGPHPTMSPRPTNASRTPDSDEKPQPGTKPAHTTNEPTTATRSTARTTAATPTTARTTKETTATGSHQTTSPAPQRTIESRENEWGWVKFPPTKTNIGEGDKFQKETAAEEEVVSSKLAPIWFKTADDFVLESSEKRGEEMGLLLLMIAGFGIFAVIVCFVTNKIMCRTALSKKETPESKEDKRKLLKPAVSSDHDEE